MSRLLALLVLLVSMALAAQEINDDSKAILADFYNHFKTASYQAALQDLQKLEQDPNQKNFALYWRALVLNKMERYDEAIQAFKEADKLKLKYPDLYYEYGQALYASDRLAPARKAFGKSVINRYKTAVSLYYMGFISQTLEDYKMAINYYKKISQLEAAEKKETEQAAQYQLAEIYYLQASKSKEPRDLVRDYVIPQFKKAKSIDTSSSIVPEIEKRIIELEEKYDLFMFKMINGRATLRPRHYIKLSQEFRYDTNVILQANNVTSTAQDKSSPISKTEAIGRYTFYPNNKISSAPELRINYVKHIGADTPAIYKNDSYAIVPAFRNAYEWSYKKRMMSHLIDYEYSYNARDVYQRKDIGFNFRQQTWMLGERFNFFSFGETTVRYRYKKAFFYTEFSDSVTNSYSFEQMIMLPQGHVAFLVGSYDKTEVVLTPTQNTNATLLRLDYIFPRLREWFTPTLSMTVMFNDPINQKQTRGLEKMYNPGVKLTRGFGKWRGNLKYDYTRNVSLDKTAFDYTKHVYGVEIEYLF